MSQEIDVRGLACPGPVMRTDKVLNELKKGTVVVIVDNAAARDNVTRLAKSRGWTVSVVERGGDYHLTLEK